MLRTLLLSRDEESVRAMSRALKEVGVELEDCPDQNAAVKKLHGKQFHAIMADDAVRGCHELLERAREVPGCHKTVRILLAGDATKIASVFGTGTQVVLYKPLSSERLRHGLRAIKNLMAREYRRGAKRFQVSISAKLTQAKFKNVAGKIVDLSETGAALQGARELNVSSPLNFECALPDGGGDLKGSAEIVWRDRRGLCGIRFTDIPVQARKRLNDWLKTQATHIEEQVPVIEDPVAQH